MRGTRTKFAKTPTQIERQIVHPLEKHDPVLVENVDFVTLEFLERAKPPIPKNQRLNKEEAFGELTGRSVLVALSHGWFFQMHPDPCRIRSSEEFSINPLHSSKLSLFHVFF